MYTNFCWISRFSVYNTLSIGWMCSCPVAVCTGRARECYAGFKVSV